MTKKTVADDKKRTTAGLVPNPTKTMVAGPAPNSNAAPPADQGGQAVAAPVLAVESPASSMTDGQKRVVVENMTPEIEGGRFPIKRTIGDMVVVDPPATLKDGDKVTEAAAGK